MTPLEPWKLYIGLKLLFAGSFGDKLTVSGAAALLPPRYAPSLGG